MKSHHLRPARLAVAATFLLAGCGRDERFVRFAEQAAERQAEQNRRMAELQNEVTEGSRRLVEDDAKSRAEFAALHREMQTERGEVGRQRDLLEEERREIAARRVADPLIAEAISQAATLAACALPLVVCWYLMRRADADPPDALVAELLLEDALRTEPLLLCPPAPHRLVGPSDRGDGPALLPPRDT